MAKTTHLKRLLEGKVVWNEWMDSDESREPDLREADLEGVDLSEYHFTNANLEGANLRSCNLFSARLGAVNLEKADLREVDLLTAQFYVCNLNETNLDSSRLESTYFQHCKLNRARLSGANAPRAYFLRGSLEGASFDDTLIAQTTFAGIDLSGVESLASVYHAGQSTIGLDTLLASGGNIPDEFIRGCGYDPLIQQVLTGDRASQTDAFYKWVEEGSYAFRLQSCFISYSSIDKVFADRLRSALNEHEVDYWYAPIHGQRGAELTPQIDREIQLRDRVILICSKSSLNDSDWVLWEIERSIEEEKRRGERMIFPVMIDDSLLSWNDPNATRIRQVLAADFRNATKGKAFKDELEKLIAGLLVDSP